jgi:hypothetical protein
MSEAVEGVTAGYADGKWHVEGARREWSGADFQVKLPSGQWWRAPLATTYAEAEVHAKLAWPFIRDFLMDSEDGDLPRLRVKWDTRAPGLNSGIPDLASGEVADGVRPDLSGFVNSKADGELAVAIFGGRAHLDFRPSEPKWIQVKVSADGDILDRLIELVEKNGGYVTSEIVYWAVHSFPKTEAKKIEELEARLEETQNALLRVAEELGMSSATNLLYLDVRKALEAKAAAAAAPEAAS